MERFPAGQVREWWDAPGNPDQYPRHVWRHGRRHCGHDRRLCQVYPSGLPGAGPPRLQQRNLRPLPLQGERSGVDQEVEGPAHHQGQNRQNRPANGNRADIKLIEQQWQERVGCDQPTAVLAGFGAEVGESVSDLPDLLELERSGVEVDDPALGDGKTGKAAIGSEPGIVGSGNTDRCGPRVERLER